MDNRLPAMADFSPEELAERLYTMDESVLAGAFEWYEPFKQMMLRHSCAISAVHTRLQVLDAEFSLKDDANPIEHIRLRLKTPLSLIRKLKRKGLQLTREDMEEHILDIAGIRVICPFVEDVYRLARALTSQPDIQVVRVRDYIKEPKPNGYRSYHVVVAVPVYFSEGAVYPRVEVQLRTIAMDVWASLEHRMLYNKGACAINDIQRRLLRCAGLSAQLDEEMQAMRRELDHPETTLPED